jgi:hypothetical protein
MFDWDIFIVIYVLESPHILWYTGGVRTHQVASLSCSKKIKAIGGMKIRGMDMVGTTAMNRKPWTCRSCKLPYWRLVMLLQDQEANITTTVTTISTTILIGVTKGTMAPQILGRPRHQIAQYLRALCHVRTPTLLCFLYIKPQVHFWALLRHSIHWCSTSMFLRLHPEWGIYSLRECHHAEWKSCRRGFERSSEWDRGSLWNCWRRWGTLGRWGLWAWSGTICWSNISQV